MAQIPRGEEHLNCPFWQKPMSEVCHKCPMWTQLRGKNPQSDSEIDQWGCALAFMPLMMLETAQQMRQAGASADKVANEVRRASDEAAARDTYLINGLRASFPVLQHLNNGGMLEDRSDDGRSTG